MSVHMWIMREFRAHIEIFSSIFLQDGSQGSTQVAKFGNKQLCQLRYLIGIDFEVLMKANVVETENMRIKIGLMIIVL